jgi:hypothetical protein
MSLATAVGWISGVTLLFILLLGVIVDLRPAAKNDLISAFGCQAAAYLLGLFAILRIHAPRAEIREFIGLRPTHAGFYALAVLLGTALQAPVSALYEAIEKRWPSPDEGDAGLLRIIADAPLAEKIALVAVLVALGPLLEEVLFRGALTRPLRRRHGPAVVIFGTALLFALAHFEPQKFVPIGLFGVALGVLRLVSGSLVPCILLHATYNAIPLVAILATAPGEGQDAASADIPLPAWLVAVSSAVAAGLLALAYLIGARTQAAAAAREKDSA